VSAGGSDPRYGWTIVAVFAVTETVSWGVLYYAFAVFQVPMQHELGWSKSELTGALSVALATSALAAFPVGRWLDRHSPRPLMTLGSVLGALLVLGWSRSLSEVPSLVPAGGAFSLKQAVRDPADPLSEHERSTCLADVRSPERRWLPESFWGRLLFLRAGPRTVAASRVATRGTLAMRHSRSAGS
jgi:MFS family permease